MKTPQAGALPIRRSPARDLNSRVAIALVALFTSLMLALAGCGGSDEHGAQSTVDPSTAAGPSSAGSPIAASGLPQLIDLGSDSCIPCQAMAPELEALATEYAGSVDVIVVDVNNTEAGANLAVQLRIRVIPTQIFVDPAGNELDRHEGYLSKEDMVAAFEQLGYALAKVAP